jgi:pimeloyl-ACP methyl ester carboxylesterase
MAQEITFSASDGVTLSARIHRGAGNRRTLLCLPSYVGTGDDFAVVANALSRNGPESRTVFTLDGRGRGRSGYRPSDGTTSVLVDAKDALDLMTLAGLDNIAVLANGYGGQVAMVMALLRPHAIGTLVLNDSAPEFETEGVVRVLSEITSLPLAGNWQDAASMLKSLHARRYPRLTDADWLALAKIRFASVGGAPARLYDPALAQSFSFSRRGLQQNTLWPQFAALKNVPMLFLRCELSDMVSPQTINRMRDLHPTLEVVTIVREGHPGLLRDQPTMAAVGHFLGRQDGMDVPAKPRARAVA